MPKRMLVAVLALALVAVTPINALASPERIHVTGSEAVVSVVPAQVISLASGGERWLDVEGVSRLECDSELLTGDMYGNADYIMLPEFGHFRGTFRIELDSGGEWRGTYVGGHDAGVFYATFRGEGYGGDVDGDRLTMDIYAYLVDAEVQRH